MKKFTIEDVQEYLKLYDKNKDCTLLSTEYINSKTPLQLLCNQCGEKFLRNFTDIKRNEKFSCARCSQGRNLSILDVQLFLQQNDLQHECTLISKQYKNYHSPLRFKCNLCDEYFERTMSQLKQKRFKCEKCAKKTQKRNKLTIVEIEQFLKENDINQNCTLLSTEYINNYTPLEFKCNLCGKNFSRTWACLKAKKAFKCRNCAYNWPEEKLTPIYESSIKYFRGKLYGWKQEFLKTHTKCDITQTEQGELHIHHLINFSTILKQASENTKIPLTFRPDEYDKNGYSLELLTNEFLKLHQEVPAVLLAKDIHYLFHKKYGFKNNTPEQYEEFKNNYLKKEEIIL